MNACKRFFSNFVTDYNSIFSAWSHIVSPYSATLCFQIARSLLSLQVVASRQTIIDPSLHQEFAGKLKSSPFSIAIDESNGRDCVTSPRPSLCDISPIGHEPTSLSCPPSTSEGTVSNVFDHLFCAGVYRQQHSMVQPRLRYHHSSAMLERILHWVPGFTGTEPIKIQKHCSTS